MVVRGFLGGLLIFGKRGWTGGAKTRAAIGLTFRGRCYLHLLEGNETWR